MAIEKVIDINIQSNAEEAVGSLRSQLRQAQAEVAAMSDKFGVTSVEAANAAKKAAELKDKIADAKNLTDAFNPDAKFKALSSSLAGVAGGFAVVQGGMALFGNQSKEVEQTLLKVQSAMALSQGLQTIGESVDSFKQLGAVAKSYTITQKIVTAGQWLWNAAMAANPIVAIVAGIAALIAAGVALVNYFKESSAAAAKNTASVNENKKALESQTKTLERNSSELDKKQSQELAMAKASGASAASIRALELKLIDEKIAYEKSARAIAFNTYEKNKNYLASLKAADADEEVIKKQQETTNKSILDYNKQNQNVQKAFDERRDIQNRHQVEILQAQTSHQKEVEDKTKKHSDKLKEDAEKARLKEIEDKKKFDEETQKQIEDLNKSQADAEKKRHEDAKAIQDELAQSQETPAQKLQREFEEKRAILEADGQSTFELEMKHNSDLENLDAEQKQKELDKEKAQSDAKLKLAEAEANAKKVLFAKTSETLNKGADLLGKNTAAGKAMAAAAALINTYQGISAELATKTVTPFEIGLKIANVAIIAATGFKSVQDILAVQIPGGGGGGGGGTSAPSGGGGMTAPSFNIVGPSGPNQIAESIANQNQQPLQAYVVSGAVTTSQALNRNIINNASIG